MIDFIPPQALISAAELAERHPEYASRIQRLIEQDEVADVYSAAVCRAGENVSAARQELKWASFEDTCAIAFARLQAAERTLDAAVEKKNRYLISCRDTWDRLHADIRRAAYGTAS